MSTSTTTTPRAETGSVRGVHNGPVDRPEHSEGGVAAEATVRAGVLVTGTEILSGRVTDRNGPWISERLAELGVEVERITCVGDRPDDLLRSLASMRDDGLQLVCTSGGLGPTADDKTAEVVGEFAGRPLQLDEAMEQKIERILEGYAKRLRFDPEALREANRKQAMIPEGAIALDPVGTAPGLVVPAEDQVIIVLPGPPRELQGMWQEAIESEPVAQLLVDVPPFRERALRLFALPESELAASLREMERENDFSELEVVTCLRGGELHVDIRYREAAEPAAETLVAGIRERHARYLYSDSGEHSEEVVASLLDGRRVAVAESCTAGLMCSRLAQRPGASDRLAGGVVAYSNEAKVELLGVPGEVISAHGAVSPEVAEAMARGAIERFDADLGIGITGIAGPEGGSAEKPVGLVCICAVDSTGGMVARQPVIPGSRTDIRERAVVVALHVLRHLLAGEEPPR